jgi:hypothetical protein
MGLNANYMHLNYSKGEGANLITKERLLQGQVFWGAMYNEHIGFQVGLVPPKKKHLRNPGQIDHLIRYKSIT